MPDHMTADVSGCYMGLLENNCNLNDGNLGRIYVLWVHSTISTRVQAVTRQSIPKFLADERMRQRQRSICGTTWSTESLWFKKAGLAFFVTNPNDFLRLLIEYRNPDTLAVPGTILCSSNTRDPDTSGEGNVLIYMDVNMGYYNRQLAMESRPLTAVCFLFRKCQLSILPWEFLPQLMSIKHAWRRGLVIWKS